jgi:hypothetical protein
VAHACDPCYSGGRDEEHFSSKPAQAKKKKRADGVGQSVEPEFKPKYCKKKKKKVSAL